MHKRRSYLIPLMIITILILQVTAVSARRSGAGLIRIDPALPHMSESPADFKIWVNGMGTAHCPHIFLVMTKSSYEGLPDGSTDSVTINWGSTLLKIGEGEWQEASKNGDKLPPEATNGAAYTVASLKDHLGTEGPIYWVFKPILDGADLTQTKVTITVTLDSSDASMLVYILGKSEDCSQKKFDMKVPPTIPGFVIPEIPLGTIMALGSMLAALTILSKRTHQITIK